jgi:hypothetical protein
MDGSLEFSKKAQAGIPLKIKAMPDTTKCAGLDDGRDATRDGVEDELSSNGRSSNGR